jgi:hypothetical protein
MQTLLELSKIASGRVQMPVIETRSLVVVVLAVGVAILLSLSSTAGNPVEAQEDVQEFGPMVRVGCKPSHILEEDPILDPPPGEAHLHQFVGNTATNADSTHESLVSSLKTTCRPAIDTSAYWFPVIREAGKQINPRKVSLYYQAPGDQTKVRNVVDGLQVITDENIGDVDYRCGANADTEKPPYGCKAAGFRIRLHFPDCWNQQTLKEGSTVSSVNGKCPRSHPYRYPAIRMVIHYPITDGKLDRPIKVSAGAGEWHGIDSMHGDIFFAPQQPVSDVRTKYCLRQVEDSEPRPDVCQHGNFNMEAGRRALGLGPSR